MATRNTIQRQLVIASVRALANHPTADEVYTAISNEFEGISKGTVYRNLNTLTEKGLLSKICIPNAADRFDHILAKHYHIKCNKCGLFTNVGIEYFHDLDENVALATGFKVLPHNIVFSGICPECMAKEKAEEKENN